MASKGQELWSKSSTDETNNSKDTSLCVIRDVLTHRKKKPSNSGAVLLVEDSPFYTLHAVVRPPSLPSGELESGREGTLPPL